MQPACGSRRDRCGSGSRLWCVSASETVLVLYVRGGALCVVGRLRGWGWSSPVLHMGEKDRCGAEVGLPQDHALSRWLSCSVVGLPCALRGVCAHGSGIGAAVETSFPHDSGVSASAERTRMCNRHRPGTRGPQPRGHPRRITTSKTLEVSQMRHHVPARDRSGASECGGTECGAENA